MPHDGFLYFTIVGQNSQKKENKLSLLQQSCIYGTGSRLGVDRVCVFIF